MSSVPNHLVSLSTKLSQLSESQPLPPYQFLSTWPERIDPETDWHLSPSLISLEGSEVYEQLNGAGKKKLAFFEAINFYSLNIHGERALIEGLAQKLYRKWPKEISEYIHHFLGEENNHMVLFGGFCEKYAKGAYPDRHLKFPRKYAEGEEDFLFFAKVLVFEEIVDHYNYINAKDGALHPVAREINRRHRQDESRHLAFGRKITEFLFQEFSPKWSAETRDAIEPYLKNYTLATLREYYSSDAYRDAGLSNPFEQIPLAWGLAQSKNRRAQATSRLAHFFVSNGIWKEGSVE